MPMSIHFNPFEYIRNESDIMSIAGILMKATTPAEDSGGNDQFFEKSQEHPLHAERHIPVIQLVSGIHLFFHVAVFHDRAGNHRREVATKQQQLSIVALYRSDFIIDIEQISQKGQRVERNSHGRQQPQMEEFQRAQQTDTKKDSAKEE